MGEILPLYVIPYVKVKGAFKTIARILQPHKVQHLCRLQTDYNLKRTFN